MPILDILAQITGEAPQRSLPPLPSAANKRKADDDLARGADKVIKREAPAGPVSRSSNVLPQPQTALRPPVSSAATEPGAASAARPNGSNAVKLAGVKPSPRPLRNTPAKVANVVSQANGGGTPSGNTDTSKVPPKKGSFKEIMARAKAAQQMAPIQIGKYQNKKTEVLTREQRQALRAKKSGRPIAPASSSAKKDGRGAVADRKPSKSVSLDEGKKKKSAEPTTGYRGTARADPANARKPAASSYSGTSRPRSAGPSSRRYTYASEEEEEEEEEFDDGYDSAASSDMEANIYEVDEEEERAARIARKEDAIAAAEEERHRREKEERRKKLLALGKSRR